MQESVLWAAHFCNHYSQPKVDKKSSLYFGSPRCSKEELVDSLTWHLMTLPDKERFDIVYRAFQLDDTHAMIALSAALKHSKNHTWCMEETNFIVGQLLKLGSTFELAQQHQDALVMVIDKYKNKVGLNLLDYIMQRDGFSVGKHFITPSVDEAISRHLAAIPKSKLKLDSNPLKDALVCLNIPKTISTYARIAAENGADQQIISLLTDNAVHERLSDELIKDAEAYLGREVLFAWFEGVIQDNKESILVQESFVRLYGEELLTMAITRKLLVDIGDLKKNQGRYHLLSKILYGTGEHLPPAFKNHVVNNINAVIEHEIHHAAYILADLAKEYGKLNELALAIENKVLDNKKLEPDALTDEKIQSLNSRIMSTMLVDDVIAFIRVGGLRLLPEWFKRAPASTVDKLRMTVSRDRLPAEEIMNYFSNGKRVMVSNDLDL